MLTSLSNDLDNVRTDLEDNVNDLKSAVNYKDYNNLLAKLTPSGTTTRGVKFEYFDDILCCKVTGRINSGYNSAFANILVSSDSLPPGFVAGNPLYIQMDGTNVELNIRYYAPGISGTENLISTKKNAKTILPANATGIIVRLITYSTDTDINEIVAPYISNTPTTTANSDDIKTLNSATPQIDKNKVDIVGLKEANSFNILRNRTLTFKTSGGITWTVNDDGSISVNGTATSTSLFDITRDEMPDWITAGEKYYVKYSSDNVQFRVLVAPTMEETVTNILTTYENAEVTIPSDTVKVTIRLAVSSGTTVNETVRPVMFDAPTNAMLADIPKPYYIDEINQTIADVKDANTEPGLVFMVCADAHYLSMIGSYPSTLVKKDSVTDMCVNMKNVAKSIRADAVVCLGDIVDSAASTSTYTTEQTKNQISYVMEKFHNIGLPFLYVIGNHDDNRYVSAEFFTPEELYSMFMSYCPTERVSDNTFNGLNYSLDYPSYKIRCLIVVEAYQLATDDFNWHYGYSPETIAWFENQLANIPEGWGVLVFTHRGLVQANNHGNALHQGQQDMIDAVQSFINGGGNYIATIYGHQHVDYSNTNPWLEISIGSAKAHNKTLDDTYAVGSVNPTRTKGTATEDLWDIVIVQPNSRTIKSIRFGAGDNRTFSY